jgi:hypothetical protein
VLDNAEVEAIDTALTESAVPIADVPAISVNRGLAFQGVIPRGDGFVLAADEAQTIMASDRTLYVDVIRPYLSGKDITTDTQQHPSRFIVDFGLMSLEDAMGYPQALDLVRKRVKPARDLDPVYADNWWRLWRPRPEFRHAIRDVKRFIAGTATGKRIFFIWCTPDWRPSNATNAFALETDYAMGVLTSRIHTDWAAKKSSTLEDRIRYTPSSAFDTFPWPQTTDDQRERIGTLASKLLAVRAAHCAEHAIGLTAVYNQLEEGPSRICDCCIAISTLRCSRRTAGRRTCLTTSASATAGSTNSIAELSRAIFPGTEVQADRRGRPSGLRSVVCGGVAGA